jgi:hypothetical protein
MEKKKIKNIKNPVITPTILLKYSIQVLNKLKLKYSLTLYSFLIFFDNNNNKGVLIFSKILTIFLFFLILLL